MIAVGVALHAGIDYSIRVGLFSWAILASYLAFIPPETASRWILKARDRLAGSRLARRSGSESPLAQPVAVEGPRDGP